MKIRFAVSPRKRSECCYMRAFSNNSVDENSTRYDIVVGQFRRYERKKYDRYSRTDGFYQRFFFSLPLGNTDRKKMTIYENNNSNNYRSRWTVVIILGFETEYVRKPKKKKNYNRSRHVDTIYTE